MIQLVPFLCHAVAVVLNNFDSKFFSVDDVRCINLKPSILVCKWPNQALLAIYRGMFVKDSDKLWLCDPP